MYNVPMYFILSDKIHIQFLLFYLFNKQKMLMYLNN